MKKRSKNTIWFYLNKYILFISMFLVIIGAFLILDASSISSILRYHNSSAYFFFKRQLFMIFIGFVGMLFIHRMPSGSYKFWSLVISAFCLVCMIASLAHSKITGAISTFTITLGPITFQPAEVIKVSTVMYMGAFYGAWVNNPKHKSVTFWIPLILCALGAVIILLGGDFGTCAIMCTLYGLVLISIPFKERWIKILKLVVLCGIIFAIAMLKFGYLVLTDKYLESGGRLSRLNYVDACDKYEDIGYQVCNGYIAMDNGGIKGAGIGESTQKYLYLDESHTDFIFPIIVEELGVWFGIFIILLYIALLFLVLKIASNTSNLRNSIICYGIGIYFMLHVFINLGGVLGIFPVTGVPLPFLSYGGTFCITMMGAFAMVQRINIENRMHREKNS